MISSLARFIIEIATYIKSLKIEQLLLVTMINKTENKHQPCAYYGMKKCNGRVIVNVFCGWMFIVDGQPSYSIIIVGYRNYVEDR